MSAERNALAGAASNDSVCWLPRSNVQVVGKANAGNRVLSKVRCPMLELHAWEHARAVLRGGGSGNRVPLPDSFRWDKGDILDILQDIQNVTFIHPFIHLYPLSD